MPPRSHAPDPTDRLTEELEAIWEQQPATERPLFPPTPVLGAPAQWTAMRHYLVRTSLAAALDDAASAMPVQRQALSCPRPSDGDLLRHERANGALPLRPSE